MPQSLQNIAQNQAQKEVTINQNFNMLTPAAAFGWRNPTVASGFNWQYWGADFYDQTGLISAVADGQVTLPASSTNFLERVWTTGAIQRVASFTNGNIPLAQISSTTTGYTTPTDKRVLMLKRQGKSHNLATNATIATNGIYTNAHGIVTTELGELIVEARLYCKTTEQGYAVNDEVVLNTNNATITVNATNSIVQLGANIQLISRSAAGTPFNITFANWGLKTIVRRVATS